MNAWTRDGLVFLAAYALGCLSTGYYLARWRAGTDVRTTGSGSTGARNVGRLLGRTAFGLIVLADVSRGALAVFLADWLDASPWVRGLVPAVVVAGHIWPAQLGFRGGRGVAVGLGALLALDSRLVFPAAAVAGLAYLVSRRPIPAGLTGAAAVPATAWALGLPISCRVGSVLVAALILIGHGPHVRAFVRRFRTPGRGPAQEQA